ncbi:MAG: T9SS type A sorting domain-containing protein, partial [Ignavibacteriaceae bacterium]
DSSHSVMAVQWINKNPQTPWADVYLSHKRFFGASTPGQWSEPINLTNSPNINNTAAHLAPYLLDEGNGHFVAFSSYVYALGATGPFSDTTAATGIYAARVPFDEIVVSVDDGINQINSFELSQNYPNPFNPTTRISYSLSERSNVTLKVYDVLGNEVATLVNTTKSAGNHVVTFGGENLASGLYIYTLKAGNFISSKKMVLIK